jgi:hypothetical protein
MKISFNYAVSFEPEVPKDVQNDVMSEVWESMKDEGKANIERVQLYSEWITDDSLILIEGFDYAIVGISEYPREVIIYDYWKCLEILMVRDGKSEDDAIEELDDTIAGCTTEHDPIFFQPFSSFADDEDDEANADNDDNDLDDAA